LSKLCDHHGAIKSYLREGNKKEIIFVGDEKPASYRTVGRKAGNIVQQQKSKKRETIEREPWGKRVWKWADRTKGVGRSKPDIGGS